MSIATTNLRSVAGSAWRIRRLLPRGRQFAMLAATALIVLHGLALAFAPLVIGKLVDGILRRDIRTMLGAAPLLLQLALIYVTREAASVARRILIESTATKVERDLMATLVHRLLRIDLAALSTAPLGTWQGRIVRSVDATIRLLKLTFLDCLPACCTAGIAIAVALSRHVGLGALVCLLIPTGLILVRHQLRSQHSVRLSLKGSREKMDAAIAEQLAGLEYIRVADTVGLEARRVQHVAEELRSRAIRHHVAMALWDATKALSDGTLHVLVIAASVSLALAGELTAGDVLIFSVLFQNVVGPLRDLHRVLDEAQEAALRASDLEHLLTTPEDPSFTPSKQADAPAPAPGEPLIEFRNVTLEYSSPGKNGACYRALDRVTLSIRAGEKIGIAGSTGSGKTSWLRLLLRLANPTAGEISIGGRPIESWDRERLAATVGYVSQIPFIIAGTIEENIGYGCPGAPPHAIQQAAQRACIHEAILAKPGGYQTIVSDREGLSGGEKARIAIARIFLKNPPIVLLDEATAAIDNRSERHIQEAINELGKDRSVIMIAHRLSTLRETDRIFVFDRGRIADHGSFGELSERPGIFADLRQASSYATRSRRHTS